MNPLLRFNLTLISLLCFSGLIAQTNYRPGYVIANNNDTLKGFIDYRGDARNSKKCDFKQSPDSKVIEFLPKDIKAFRFNDGKFYVSKKIISEKNESTVFLEFLVNGIADLYYLKEDNDEDHYFIEKSDGTMFELASKEELTNKNGKTYVHEYKKYTGLLKIAFADCPKIFPLIDQTLLEEKPLIDLTKKYHNYVCDSMKCIIYEKQISAIKITFAPFISLNTSFLNFRLMSGINPVEFNSSFYGSLGLLMNTSFPGINEKVSFQFSEEAGRSYFSSNSGKVDFHSLVLKTKAALKYSYPKGRLRPTIMIGGNMVNLLTSKGIRFQDPNYTAFYKTNFNLNFGQNIDLGTDYYFSSALKGFFGIGYSVSNGPSLYYSSSDNSALSFATRIRTFSINAGLYF
jgi:hypothetical protein